MNCAGNGKYVASGYMVNLQAEKLFRKVCVPAGCKKKRLISIDISEFCGFQIHNSPNNVSIQQCVN
jgi:hypothetical protein